MTKCSTKILSVEYNKKKVANKLTMFPLKVGKNICNSKKKYRICKLSGEFRLAHDTWDSRIDLDLGSSLASEAGYAVRMSIPRGNDKIIKTYVAVLRTVKLGIKHGCKSRRHDSYRFENYVAENSSKGSRYLSALKKYIRQTYDTTYFYVLASTICNNLF